MILTLLLATVSSPYGPCQVPAQGEFYFTRDALQYAAQKMMDRRGSLHPHVTWFWERVETTQRERGSLVVNVPFDLFKATLKEDQVAAHAELYRKDRTATAGWSWDIQRLDSVSDFQAISFICFVCIATHHSIPMSLQNAFWRTFGGTRDNSSLISLTMDFRSRDHPCFSDPMP